MANARPSLCAFTTSGICRHDSIVRKEHTFATSSHANYDMDVQVAREIMKILCSFASVG
jgi:hypothetical protein